MTCFVESIVSPMHQKLVVCVLYSDCLSLDEIAQILEPIDSLEMRVLVVSILKPICNVYE